MYRLNSILFAGDGEYTECQDAEMRMASCYIDRNISEIGQI